MLVHEKYEGHSISKFPGGGLQFGEGTIDCLKREFLEEFGTEIEILSHFYTTDFFQPSAFNPLQQVISIYYTIKMTRENFIPVSQHPFIKVNFIKRINLCENDVTFNIDKAVVRLILNTMPQPIG